MTKKYYWLKLKNDFFKRHDVRIVEGMPNGKDYVLFYLKLLVESVGHDGSLRFSETIPYSPDMLATITNTNIDVVKAAIKIFTELKLMDILDDNTIYMNEIEKMTGSETRWAEKKRLQRENKKLLVDNTETTEGQKGTMSDKSIELELEKDIIHDDIIILTEQQSLYMNILKNIPSYPFDSKRDLEYYNEMEVKYPQLNLIEAIEKFRVYKLDKPFKNNANYRSQINTSFNNYCKWGNCKKSEPPKPKKTFSTSIPVIDDGFDEVTE